MILFKNTLFQKEFLACNGCFGLFSKIKKGSGASFWCNVFYKSVSYLILYQLTKFQCHTLFVLKISNKMCYLGIIQTADDVTNLKSFFGPTSKTMTDREKKGGKMKIQKSGYLENEKIFLDEIKKHFSQFLKGFHLVKNKNFIKNSGHQSQRRNLEDALNLTIASLRPGGKVKRMNQINRKE